MLVLSTLATVAAATLLAVWVIYPVIVGAMAWLRTHRPRMSVSPPYPESKSTPVSVILATRDDEGAVRARVVDILRTAYDLRLTEIVIAVDAATARPFDGSAFEEFGKSVIVVRGDAPGGKAAGLNAAVRASHGTLLVFADVAQRFTPDTIPELVSAFDDPAMGATSGSLEIPPGSGGALSRRYWSFERWLRECEAQLHSAVGVTGAVSAMRRELWRPLPAGLILDDVFTPMRLVVDGYRVGFAPRARAFEQRVIDSRTEYRRKVRTQTGVIQLCAWMPAVLHPLRNPIWLQFLCHKMLRLSTPYCAFLICAWALATTVRVLGALDQPWMAFLLLVPLIAVLARRRRGAAMSEVLMLQLAVVVASINGLRGRWEVWR